LIIDYWGTRHTHSKHNLYLMKNPNDTRRGKEGDFGAISKFRVKLYPNLHLFEQVLEKFKQVKFKLSVCLGLQFQKVRFKIMILKCAIWKKWFLKTQLSVWQNRKLAFKIMRFQKSIISPAIWKSRFSAFSNRNF